MATVKANGYTHIPAPVEGYEAGTELEVMLTTDPGSIERTLILTGTIEPALEKLADLVHDRGLFIHATNPGNFTGILALKNTTCHAAPLVLPAHHLLGSYQPLMQVAIIKDLAFIHIARVELGIASRDGLDLSDIVHARFINTRKDTPSRSVLDALLAAKGIDTVTVNGYRQEVHGPPAVAAAIRNGFADAGICTSGIARANGLAFVPLAHEDYELAVRNEMLTDPRILALTTTIGSPEYLVLLKTIGGYDTTLSGTIRELGRENSLVPISGKVLP
jgi:putative molybdopterin biosynthesis protein